MKYPCDILLKTVRKSRKPSGENLSNPVKPIMLAALETGPDRFASLSTILPTTKRHHHTTYVQTKKVILHDIIEPSSVHTFFNIYPQK
mmetsp:Transcript_8490/g.11683  ORF Transcript_8490/g.11683 Transcript_8490/m.11683 type:complete len:88 (+) Transcript_8490:67-330(+)